MGKTRKIPKSNNSLSNISNSQAKDTGMAMVLICLIISIFTTSPNLTILGTFLLIINMVIPAVFKPVAIVWLGLSHLIGTVMSKIILSIIFYLMVTPIGVIRRYMGKDPLKLNLWKNSNASVFENRDKSFSAEDIETPY